MTEETTLLTEEGTASPKNTEETTPTEESTEEVTETPEGEEPSQETPTEYTEFTMPEGMEPDTELLESFTEVAKANELSQETAQSLVDWYAKFQQDSHNAQMEVWTKTTEDWRTHSEGDKEFGGRDFKENLGLANKFLSKYGTPELMEALAATGVGNHPEFIRVFVRAGKALSEDKLEFGSPVDSGPKDPAKVLYPDMN